MYKLIAIDMDGTLLRSDHTVSDYSKDILRKATNAGAKIVITTGRPIEGVTEYIKEIDVFGDNGYVICNNGATIYSTKNLKPIYSNYIDPRYVKEFFELGMSLNLPVEAICDGYSINTTKLNYFRNTEAAINPNSTIVINHINELDKYPNILKVMFIDEIPILDDAIKNIPNKYNENFNLIRSLPQIYEFLNKDCSKGQAITKLCEILDIDIADTIAFGDAPNDYDMLTLAGIGIAMGNAYPEIKELADAITDTNDNDGVARFLSEALNGDCVR